MDFIYVKGKANAPELIMTVLVPVLLGVLSFLLVKNYTGLYIGLANGKMLPPIITLPIIWLIVLVLMGVASYRMKLAAPSSNAHVFYASSLALAFLWNVSAMRFEKLYASFFIIILYLISLTATFFEFEKNDRRSGYLMIPAIIWAIALAIFNFYSLK